LYIGVYMLVLLPYLLIEDSPPETNNTAAAIATMLKTTSVFRFINIYYQNSIIKTMTNSICGCHLWYLSSTLYNTAAIRCLGSSILIIIFVAANLIRGTVILASSVYMKIYYGRTFKQIDSQIIRTAATNTGTI
jgi:hypothetical protein